MRTRGLGIKQGADGKALEAELRLGSNPGARWRATGLVCNPCCDLRSVSKDPSVRMRGREVGVRAGAWSRDGWPLGSSDDGGVARSSQTHGVF